MNLLLDGLQDTIVISGRQVPIETGFRTGILFEQVLMDRALSEKERIYTVIALYLKENDYPKSSEELDEALRGITWFYRCGAEQNAAEDRAEKDEDAFSYEYDADYIYAAFMAAYRIDLARDSLHWWQFRALFRALPQDTEFIRIVGYRLMEIPAKMSREEKARYRRLKDMYALPIPEERKQINDALEDVLMNGGDITTLL